MPGRDAWREIREADALGVVLVGVEIERVVLLENVEAAVIVRARGGGRERQHRTESEERGFHQPDYDKAAKPARPGLSRGFTIL